MKKYIGIVFTLVGICLMVYGVYLDEITSIMQKSITICLECIGIG